MAAKDPRSDGTTGLRIAVTGLRLGQAGTLPVRPTNPLVDRISAGMAIPVTTLAALAFQEGRVRVVVPLPLTLSNDPPAAEYTAAPMRTAAPMINGPRRGGRGAHPPPPGPTASPSAQPAASASPSPPPSVPPSPPPSTPP